VPDRAPDELLVELAQLRARTEITEVLHRYCRGLDRTDPSYEGFP
jgi:hypothetical protein